MKRQKIALVLLGGLWLMACSQETMDTGQLQQVKTALAPFEDVEYAMHHGYFPTAGYAADANGGIGIHFVNPDALGIQADRPNILLYNLEEDGTYTLGAAEWIVPITWVEEAPVLFGRTFDGPILAHHDDMVDHYELHVWLFEDNPNGLFALSNPSLSPPSYWEDLEVSYNAIQKYVDPDQALADGYVSSSLCVADSDGAGMGIHFVHHDAGYLDPAHPNVLIYQPGPAGKLTLAAAEWQAPADIFGAAPTMFGRSMDGPYHGDNEMKQHYELHAWLFAANPNGIFHPFNPMLSCDGAIKQVQ
jgi:hypothetical protein